MENTKRERDWTYSETGYLRGGTFSRDSYWINGLRKFTSVDIIRINLWIKLTGGD